MSESTYETRELKERVVEINRVAKVVKGGRRFSFTALVVIGDEVDRVRVGYGQAREVPLPISKAVDDAKKNADKLNMLTNTAPLVLWIVGGVMLVLGIFLTVMGSRSGGSVHRHRGSRAQKPEPAGARSA